MSKPYMSGYDYEEQTHALFTPAGVDTIIAVLNHARKLIEASGVAKMSHLLEAATGDSWQLMACVEYLEKWEYLKEVPLQGEVWGQHRIFRAGSKL